MWWYVLVVVVLQMFSGIANASDGKPGFGILDILFGIVGIVLLCQ